MTNFIDIEHWPPSAEKQKSTHETASLVLSSPLHILFSNRSIGSQLHSMHTALHPRSLSALSIPLSLHAHHPTRALGYQIPICYSALCSLCSFGARSFSVAAPKSFTSSSCSNVYEPRHFSLLFYLNTHYFQQASASAKLRRSTEGATYIRQGGHHVGHWPTFLVFG